MSRCVYNIISVLGCMITNKRKKYKNLVVQNMRSLTFDRRVLNVSSKTGDTQTFVQHKSTRTRVNVK